jgi:hypothetical protein
MKISDAIRTLILLRKPTRQPEMSEEMILDFTNNNAQQESTEEIPSQAGEEEKV